MPKKAESRTNIACVALSRDNFNWIEDLRIKQRISRSECINTLLAKIKAEYEDNDV